MKQSTPECDWQARDELVRQHSASLDELVALGELDEPVAYQVRIAFSEAVDHLRYRVICYEPGPRSYPVRVDLVQQADALLEAADDLDPATVERVQEAIMWDIAIFESIRAGETSTIETSPEAAEAARFLVELLLEE